MHVKNPPTSFISCSDTARDYITSLSFSFGCCAFEIKFVQILHEINTLQELLFVIWFDLVDFSGNLMCSFLKSTGLNTEKTIVTQKYSIFRPPKKNHRLFRGVFYTMNHLTIVSV